MKIINSAGGVMAGAAQGRWQMLVQRQVPPNPFYYGVKTTGIFCRPNCRSRLPKQEHVLFFDSPQEAVAAGFRACKRCQPGAPTYEAELKARVLRVCRQLEQPDTTTRLDVLSKAAGLSASHFQRVFKAIVGVTPKQYQAMHRMNRFRRELRRADNITEAIYGAGFNSSSRAYERVSAKLGMTPRQFQKGGKGTIISFALSRCALGWLLVALSERGICAVEVGGSAKEMRDNLKASFQRADLHEEPALLEAHIKELLAWLESPNRGLNLPLDIRGTAFQQRVWQALRAIPPGETRSYKQIARAIEAPKAVRAVASACAANRLALAIPCHRAVRRDGALGGYRWGLERKRALLDREREVGRAPFRKAK